MGGGSEAPAEPRTYAREQPSPLWPKARENKHALYGPRGTNPDPMAQRQDQEGEQSCTLWPKARENNLHLYGPIKLPWMGRSSLPSVHRRKFPWSGHKAGPYGPRATLTRELRRSPGSPRDRGREGW